MASSGEPRANLGAIGGGGTDEVLSAGALLGLSVEEFDAADVETLGDAELADELVGMRRAIDRLEAQFSRRLVRFEAIQGYESAGATNLLSWLRWACRMGTSAAARRLHMARQLIELPQTESAWRSGAISSGHAAVIGRAVDEVGAEHARSAEPTLLEAAEHMNPGHVWLVGQQIRHTVDPDGALAASNAAYARRRLNLTTNIDGALELAGLFDAEGGAVLRTAIDALTRPLPGDQRISAQRRADALVELARRQLDGGVLPGAGGQRPHLNITVSAGALRREDDAPPAELEWVGPITADTVRRLGCDAVRCTLVLDERGSPLSVGRATRTISPALRRALIVRDRGCRFPGCDRPPSWTDAHHLVHWADEGDTEIKNLVLLCRPHHRFVHEEGWTLRWGDGAEVLATPP
ncbi:MAG: DUF222 domain-containing protein [Candidatus Dormibacteraeota bacterium]|uniref:DUF222 domain-containing protein n=1 Tax=Candidatus Amunia macphersoniae TaxID=3127014 RepID=A0A934NDR7_9BACT|nr:DUF222 domain-containing protein [Candidatus Dormibacteraeota bacterium]